MSKKRHNYLHAFVTLLRKLGIDRPAKKTNRLSLRIFVREKREKCNYQLLADVEERVPIFYNQMG